MIFEALECFVTPFNYEDHIPRIEGYIRHSKEYKAYLSSVYSKFKQISAPILKLNDIKDSNITIEYHHVIFLANLVRMVILKYFIDSGESSVSVWKIVDLVMNLHLEDKLVGVILPKNLHEMYHDGNYDLTSNLKSVYIGANVSQFITEYKEYLDDDDFKLLESLGVKHDK